MKSVISSIDASGHLLVPEGIRQQAGLAPGTAVEIRYRDGQLEIEPTPRAVRIVKKGDVYVAVPDKPLPPLTAELVRETQEAIRDRHLED